MSALAITRAYQHSFDTHPNITLAITGGLLNSLGDCAAQISSNALSDERDNELPWYDFQRTLRFFVFGVAISPFLGRWNAFLEHRFPLRTRQTKGKVSIRALSKRVACDQLIMAPIGLGLFLGSMGIMEGRSRSQIREKIVDLYKPALWTNWKIWPLAQLINFRYMPLPYRVPFQSSCGVFWTLYLSLLNASEDERQDKQQESEA